MPLTSEDRIWLSDQNIAFSENYDAQHGAVVIFQNRPLPAGKYTVSHADILSVLPGNYPDSGPDMFWVKPFLLLAQNGSYARQTQVFQDIVGATWQRWSRHYDAVDWRSGIDDIATVYRRIDNALKIAQ